MKRIIKNFTLQNAIDFFESVGQEKYRSNQLLNWLYEKNVTSFSEMTNFSKNLRDFLDEKFIISPLELKDRLISKIDNTEKYLFATHDNYFIESILIKNEFSDEGRLTVCLSSQAGCAMGCSICETGKIGFHRNLETGEIIDQLCQIRRVSGLINNNIVFMGMGEPFMNYDNVLNAADIMNYTFGHHISVRKITISTCGIKNAIQKFINEGRPYNIAISLNDTNPEKRKRIMPVEMKFPIKNILSLLEKNSNLFKNRLTIEYVMRKDNISPLDAKRLKDMFVNKKIKINLIPLNIGDHNYIIPSDEDIDRFYKEFLNTNLSVSIRKSMGSDISGACGQLSGRMY